MESGRKKYLLIANAYPSDNDIYKYVFVHQRVKYYLTHGLEVTVYRVDRGSGSTVTSYRYDDVQVLCGDQNGLDELLKASAYDTYLVHFPVPYILDSLVRIVPEASVIVWLHGYETEAWHRRWFDFLDERSLERLVGVRSNYFKHKMPFLRSLYSGALINVRFVIVSKWFLKHRVEIDAGSTLVNPNVIPNFIDTDFFYHSAKAEDQRFHVLTIRPFTSNKYANDLTVQAILGLRKHPLWHQLRFTIRGDGPDFENALRPLYPYGNIDISKGFLSRDQIRDLHRTHGLFLAPTRFDSQGVSTGEAMSSGLVPISTDITAVPEYVEHGVSGLLSQPEDTVGLTSAIVTLVDDPKTFVEMSINAAARVRETSNAESTVLKELELINDDAAGRGQDFGPVDWSAAYADLMVEMNSFVSQMKRRVV